MCETNKCDAIINSFIRQSEGSHRISLPIVVLVTRRSKLATFRTGSFSSSQSTAHRPQEPCAIQKNCHRRWASQLSGSTSDLTTSSSSSSTTSSTLRFLAAGVPFLDFGVPLPFLGVSSASGETLETLAFFLAGVPVLSMTMSYLPGRREKRFEAAPLDGRLSSSETLCQSGYVRVSECHLETASTRFSLSSIELSSRWCSALNMCVLYLLRAGWKEREYSQYHRVA
jgi:hypothetical protein